MLYSFVLLRSLKTSLPIVCPYTRRNAQVAASLLSPSRYQDAVRIACSGLMITSLLKVVNRLAASCELHTGLMQVVSSTFSKSCKYVAASLQMFVFSKLEFVLFSKLEFVFSQLEFVFSKLEFVFSKL